MAESLVSFAALREAMWTLESRAKNQGVKLDQVKVEVSPHGVALHLVVQEGHQQAGRFLTKAVTPKIGQKPTP